MPQLLPSHSPKFLPRCPIHPLYDRLNIPTRMELTDPIHHVPTLGPNSVPHPLHSCPIPPSAADINFAPAPAFLAFPFSIRVLPISLVHDKIYLGHVPRPSLPSRTRVDHTGKEFPSCSFTESSNMEASRSSDMDHDAATGCKPRSRGRDGWEPDGTGTFLNFLPFVIPFVVTMPMNANPVQKVPEET